MMNKYDIDWDRIWKAMMIKNQRQKRKKDCVAYWDDEGQARYLDAKAREDDWARSKEIIKKLDISTSSRVLDIGAGPGTLAIPLSRVVKDVMAIEPADAMECLLRENIKKEKANNINVIKKRWEDIELDKDIAPPYDIVISSFSLGTINLRDSLKKMNEASSRYVYIFWFAGTQFWEQTIVDVWKAIFGKEYAIRPQINCVYNLLYNMGIYANVEIYQEENIYKYPEIDAAIGDIMYGFGSATKMQEMSLREYLTRKLVIDGDMLALKGKSYYARLWWDKKIMNDMPYQK